MRTPAHAYLLVILIILAAANAILGHWVVAASLLSISCCVYLFGRR